MKNLLSGILLFICFFTLNAQDKVTLKNGKELSVYIIEKNDTEIEYKLENPTTSNTSFSTKLSKVKMINYENGEIDLLSSQNPRSIYPLGISGGVSLIASEYEGGMFTAGVDYFFTPNISAEINFGSGGESDVYYSFGGRYWFAKKYGISGFSPFTGLLYGAQYGVNFWEVPVGISYITKFGMQSSFHISHVNYINALVSNEMSRLNVELRIGWRFK